MDLFRAMQAFVAVVQTGSMSAAAKQLDLSPAMIGQHVAALEERLNTRLINRTTRRQNLTNFGSSYFEQCRDILERLALAEMEAETLQQSPSGKLRITAPTTFGAEALIPALKRYRELAPEVRLDIVLTDRNVDLVGEGIDVAFRIGSLSDSSMIARALLPYRMMICAAPDYLARHGWPRHPEELSSHEAILFTSAAKSLWRLSKGEEVVEIAPACQLIVNGGQAIRVAARNGLGIVMQPEILLAADVRDGLLVQLFPEWRLSERPMWLLYYRDQLMTLRLRSFISFALAEFGLN